MSQASVRLRELERDVEASRDVYQSFLKRSRETEEQESLNTSSARIIGEATVPQRRTFPPAMSLLAMIGFMLGALAAAAWVVAADRLRSGRATTPGRDRAPKADAARVAGQKIPSQPPPPASRKPAAARDRADRKAADRAAAGIRRDADARRHPGRRRHCRRDADRLADAARGLAADDLPQRHARDARDRWPSARRPTRCRSWP